MARKIKILLTALILILFILNTSLLSQRRETQPVRFEKISERLYQIMGGSGAQGGAYVGDNGVLIIDAKMNEESVKQVIQEVKNITDKPIVYLVNTHSDGDHIRGNKFFPQSVTFIAHENCRKEFFISRNDIPSEWKDPALAPFVPSITFKNQMDIYLGGKKVELWYFGIGHTTGDAVVYFPEEKTAFLGDQIFIGRPQLIHSYKGGNSFAHVNTLSKLLKTLDVEKYCSGHSAIVDRTVIEKHILQMKERQEKIAGLIKQGKNFDEIKNAFEENEARLVTSIFNEIKENKIK